jgi:hypothetical protein
MPSLIQQKEKLACFEDRPVSGLTICFTIPSHSPAKMQLTTVDDASVE